MTLPLPPPPPHHHHPSSHLSTQVPGKFLPLCPLVTAEAIIRKAMSTFPNKTQSLMGYIPGKHTTPHPNDLFPSQIKTPPPPHHMVHDPAWDPLSH